MACLAALIDRSKLVSFILVQRQWMMWMTIFHTIYSLFIVASTVRIVKLVRWMPLCFESLDAVADVLAM